MNIEQSVNILFNKGVNIFDGGRYYAPEFFQDNTIFCFICETIYPDKIYTHIFVLCEFYESFKNRVLGNIKDDWFTKKTFGKIAKECYDTLEELSHLPDSNMEEWQILLKDQFKSMI